MSDYWKCRVVVMQAKKLEEFVSILGNEFEFSNEKVDCNAVLIQCPNCRGSPWKLQPTRP